jgi:hypothetical protein
MAVGMELPAYNRTEPKITQFAMLRKQTIDDTANSYLHSNMQFTSANRSDCFESY